MIKLEVPENSLRYSKNKTKQAKQREIYLEQTIARLQEELDNKTTGDTLISHLEEQLNDSRLELSDAKMMQPFFPSVKMKTLSKNKS